MPASKICLTLTARTLDEDFALVEKYRALIDIAELRADCLNTDELNDVGSFRSRANIPCILTVRRKEDGGMYTGSDADRNSIFARAVNFDFVDFECDFDSAEAEKSLCGSSVRIIRSKHVFSACSGSLAATADIMCRSAQEIPKIAFMPGSLADVTALFKASTELPPRERIFCAMGSFGTVSRILASRTRSFLTYVSPAELIANTTAIGHIDPAKLNDTYAFRSINEKTIICGVTGWPLAVTSSPEVHRTFYKEANLNAVMVPLPSENIADTIDFAETVGLRGLAVTVPHKEHLLPFLDETDNAVDSIGAANTVVWRNGKRYGYNTDAAGFSQALKEFLDKDSLCGMNVAIIGSGGAARAIAYAVKQLGGNGHIYARNVNHAKTIADKYGFSADAIEHLGKYGNPDLIVQCTSVGNGSSNPADDPILNYEFKGTEALYDLVYKPAITPVMARASTAGCRIQNGMSMLKAQALIQHKLFFRLWS